MNRFSLTLIFVALLSLGLAACTVVTTTGGGSPAAAPDAPDAPDAPATPDAPEAPPADHPNAGGVTTATIKYPADSLGGLLSGYSRIKVTHTDWGDDPAQNKIRVGGITDKAKMTEALKLTDPHQKPQVNAARCLFSYHLDFQGADKNIIGRVGVCKNPKLKKDHTGVLVKLDENGETISRQGIKIPDANALAQIIEEHIKTKQ